MTCCRDINDQKPSTKRCMCLPYNEPSLIAGQIFSILAFVVSWASEYTLVMSFIGMMLFQFFWCRRRSAVFLRGASLVALVTSLVKLVAFYTLYTSTCVTFVIDTFFTDIFTTEKCHDTNWSFIPVGCAVLWGCSAVCLFSFERCGKHARWEQKYSASSDDKIEDDLELGKASPPKTETVTRDDIEPTEPLESTVPLPKPILPPKPVPLRPVHIPEPIVPPESSAPPEHMIKGESPSQREDLFGRAQ